MADTKERSAFVKEFSKQAKDLADVAKETQGGGFLSDEDIIETLGLTADTKKQVRTRVTRVAYGIDKNRNPYFSFNWGITSGPNAGLIISKFVGLGGKTKDDRVKRLKQLVSTFQRLDIDTTKWPAPKVMQLAVDNADTLTTEKPGVLLALSTWGDDNDRLNIDIVGMFDASAETKPAPSDVPPSTNGSASSKAASKAKAAKAENVATKYAAMGLDTDNEDADHSEELSGLGTDLGITGMDDMSWEELGAAIDAASVPEEQELPDPLGDIDFESYVGFACKFNTGDDEVDVTPVSYDADAEIFSLEDEDGNEYEDAWQNMDFGEGYGVPME